MLRGFQIPIIIILSFNSLSWSIDYQKALQIAREQGSQPATSSSAKKSPYMPLFNHYEYSQKNANDPIQKEKKQLARQDILSKLIELLNNDQVGLEARQEYINQEENDLILRMIVRAQLKRSDLIQLIQDYKLQMPEEFKHKDHGIPYADGLSVLSSFQSVQSRIEEIESNLWDTRHLPQEFAGRQFKCFYLYYPEAQELKKYMQSVLQEYRQFINAFKQQNPSSSTPSEITAFMENNDTMNSHTTKQSHNMSNDMDASKIINHFEEMIFGYKTDGKAQSLSSSKLTEKELKTHLYHQWNQRFVIARCLTTSEITRVKGIIKKHFESIGARRAHYDVQKKLEELGLFSNTP